MRMGQPLDIFKPVLHPNGLIPMTTRSKTKLGQLNLWRSCFQLLLVYQFDLHGHWPSQESSIFCRYIIIIIIYIYTHTYIYMVWVLGTNMVHYCLILTFLLYTTFSQHFGPGCASPLCSNTSSPLRTSCPCASVALAVAAVAESGDRKRSPRQIKP